MHARAILLLLSNKHLPRSYFMQVNVDIPLPVQVNLVTLNLTQNLLVGTLQESWSNCSVSHWHVPMWFLIHVAVYSQSISDDHDVGLHVQT